MRVALLWIVAAATLGVACFHPSYDRPACSPEGECPAGLHCVASVCERLPPDGGMSEQHSFGPTELRAGQLADMTVDATRAALTPNAYTYGGLVAHGLGGLRLWTYGDTSWSKLDGKTANGAGLWAGEELHNGVRLGYVGLPDDTTMTLWLEGEVWLDASSTETFRVAGNDIGFADLAPPGTTAFTRVAENATVTVPTGSAGWYPIRIGFSNGDGVFDFLFSHSDTGGAQVAWTRDRLRARTSELSGMLRTVFGQQILGGGQGSWPPVPHFDQSDLLTTTNYSPPPQGAGNDEWSARYLGQVYVEQAGSYTLTITSDDGNRGRLGTGRGAASWNKDEGAGVGDAVTPVAATLAAGWNDVTVDYNQVAAMRSLQVQIQGPDFSSPVAVPADRLRPVEPADDRLALGIDETSHTVPDGGDAGNPGTATMTIAGYAAEFSGSIELTYQATSQRWADLRIDLETPNGTRVRLPNPASLSAGTHVMQLTISANPGGALGTLLNVSARGAWKLHMYDVNVGLGNSTLESARLTLHTKGGPEKIARTATWTSAPLDAMTRLIAIDGVTWTERVPAGATVQVRFRTCQQADCSDAPKWSDPVASGVAAAVSPARYLQLRVEMTSDGTLEPEIRSLAVAYRRE